MELKSALAASKLRMNSGLETEHIVYFLHQFADFDYSDIDCQKRLIKIFVNSVFVYDDKVVLTFNYSGDNRTITLNEIDAGLEHGLRMPRLSTHHKNERLQKKPLVFNCLMPIAPFENRREGRFQIPYIPRWRDG